MIDLRDGPTKSDSPGACEHAERAAAAASAAAAGSTDAEGAGRVASVTATRGCPLPSGGGLEWHSAAGFIARERCAVYLERSWQLRADGAFLAPRPAPAGAAGRATAAADPASGPWRPLAPGSTGAARLLPHRVVDFSVADEFLPGPGPAAHAGGSGANQGAGGAPVNQQPDAHLSSSLPDPAAAVRAARLGNDAGAAAAEAAWAAAWASERPFKLVTQRLEAKLHVGKSTTRAALLFTAKLQVSSSCHLFFFRSRTSAPARK